MHRVAGVVGLVGALAGIAFPAEATVFRAVAAEALGAQADAVVMARRPLGVDTREEMRFGRIVTEVRLEVARVLAAGPRGQDAGRGVSVVLPGGVVSGPRGPIAQHVAGTPEFVAGAWQVVFLRRLSDGRWTVLDLALGVYPLRQAPDGQWRVLPPRLAEVTLVDAQGRPADPGSLGIPPEGLPWTDFVRRLPGARP